MQSALVTGGAGFIGSAVVRQAIRDGHAVTLTGIGRVRIGAVGEVLFEADPALAGAESSLDDAEVSNER
jgi:dTDP-glucose 4,6-dehydratase